MLLIVVSKGVLVEVRCILYGTDESKLLKEKEDYVILDLANYHTCKPTGWLNGISQQLIGNGKKENKLYEK
jgi:hypothetical protein